MFEKIPRLADEIDRRWTANGRAKDEFPALAAACLAEEKLGESFSLEKLTRWLLREPYPAPPSSRFGNCRQTSLPLFRHPTGDFEIDLLLWQTESTVIHDHDAEGASQTLAGECLIASYRYECEDEIVPDCFRIGRLVPTQVDWVRAPAGGLLLAGDEGLHRLHPLGGPTVTIQVRLPFPQPRRNTTFFFPGLALAARIGEDPLLEKRMFLHGLLERTHHPGAESFLEGLLFGPDAALAAGAFLKLCAQSSDWEPIRRTARRMAQAHAWGETLEETAKRFHIENRQLSSAPENTGEDRLFLGLLNTHGVGKKMAEFFEQHFPAESLSSLLLKWAERVSNKNGLNPKLMLCLQTALERAQSGELSKTGLQELADTHLQHELDRDTFSLWGFGNLSEILPS